MGRLKIVIVVELAVARELVVCIVQVGEEKDFVEQRKHSLAVARNKLLDLIEGFLPNGIAAEDQPTYLPILAENKNCAELVNLTEVAPVVREIPAMLV